MNTNVENAVEGKSQNLGWLLSALGVLAILVTVVWWPGCRQYPAVTSPEALQTMKLLYAACNTKDTNRLREVEKRIDGLARDGKLSDAEQKAFSKIVTMANAGDWQSAEAAAFRFAQDQVGVGHPSKTRHDD